jgi:CheY-like chemotaxis protein
MSSVILVIDDDALIRRLTAHLLLAEGFKVLPAAGGAEGLALLRSGKAVSAVVCDLIMPGMSGIEVVREIRGDEGLKHLPILVLTSQGLHQDRDEAIETGADDFMTKPFSSFEFIDNIKRLAGPGNRKAA